ncbi:MAG TPA: PDZ domain-containing protein [Verrucomicrobiae bacterium]
MNSLIGSLPIRWTAKLILSAGIVCLFAGCASEKSKPVAQRGWIGGEYAVTKSPQKTQKAALRITELSTNAPAWNAGLRPNDLILQLDQHPLATLQDFQRLVDQSKPGDQLAVKALHDGKVADYTVRVGRETFRRGGCFSVVVPTVVHPWDLWPNPGFSLVLLGYEPNYNPRPELGKQHELYEESWKAYLIFFEVSSGKRVLSETM